MKLTWGGAQLKGGGGVGVLELGYLRAKENLEQPRVNLHCESDLVVGRGDILSGRGPRFVSLAASTLRAAGLDLY